MSDGFLGRWSRRKLDVKQGKPVEAEPPALVPAPPSVIPAPSSVIPAPSSVIPAQAGIHPHGDASHVDSRLRGNDEEAASPPPPLEDVHALTPESDFSRFAASDVAPEVKNAAMKKLFADPHFNVMDGLDVYIDDYTKPDPIPEAMLRQLASSQFLGLFREEEGTDEPAAGPRDHAEAVPDASVAQSQPAVAASPAPASTEVPAHADPDLRLQQDHAARPGQAGRGTG